MAKRKIVSFSCEEAVIEVLDEMAPGEKLLGYEICERVYSKFKRHGRVEVPMQQTIMRRVREQRDRYWITAKHGSVSEYTKAEV